MEKKAILFTVAIENIKFVKYKVTSSAKTPLETQSALKDRVYVLVKDDKLKSITFYDKDGKKNRQIDLDHKHAGQMPHAHDGYEGPHAKEPDPLTAKDKHYIKHAREIWEEFKNE